MSKRKTDGLPYLQTTLKFNFNSMGNMDDASKTVFQEQLKVLLKQHLNSLDLGEPAATGHELQISIGLQPVFTLIGESKAEIVLLDSGLLKASAVSHVIGLYVQNSGATAYSVENLTETLSTMNIIADGVATTSSAQDLNKFMKQSSLKPISLPLTAKLNPTVVIQSQGKQKKKKLR